MKNQWSICLLGLLLLSPQTLRAQAQTALSNDPVEYIVEDIRGPHVQVLEENSQTWITAQEGQVIESGDEIKVGDGSETTLTLQDHTQVHLSAGTDVKVDQIEPNEDGGFLSRLSILAGTILSDVKKNLLSSHSSFEIEAGGVVCGVRGTAFEVSNINGQVETSTHEGQVATAVGTDTHLVSAGNVSSYQAGHFRGMRALRPEERARFQKWRAFRKNVLNERLMRIRAIRSGRRAAWVRQHPHSAQVLRRREEIRRRYQRRRNVN